MKLHSVSFAAALCLFLSWSASAQDHGHFYVGATTPSQGAQLVIQNAADFINTSDYVKTLNFTNGGRYAGFFEGNITFEAKSSTDVFGDPDPNSAALGAWIFAQITAVEGPVGGAFNFWESNATSPSFTIPSGSSSTNEWAISQNNGAPGTNPFGHIHGRRFTATLPGIYTVTFRAVDHSTNGTGGGAIHTPSDTLKVSFQAGINVASITRSANGSAIRFGSLLGRTFYLEANSSLSTTNWNEISSVSGDDHFLTLNDTNNSAAQFYRIRVSNP